MTRRLMNFVNKTNDPAITALRRCVDGDRRYRRQQMPDLPNAAAYDQDMTGNENLIRHDNEKMPDLPNAAALDQDMTVNENLIRHDN